MYHGNGDPVLMISFKFGDSILHATQGDYSRQFPKGYAYALNLSGGAGPETSSEGVALSQDEQRAANDNTLATLRAALGQ